MTSVNLAATDLHRSAATQVESGVFEPERHFYPRVLNAQIHPYLSFFMRMDNARIIKRFCHLNPRVDGQALTKLLSTPTKHFRWAGADLFHVTDDDGRRSMVVIETNSCPSGNKSMPILADEDEQGGYQRIVNWTFLPHLKRKKLPTGALAVLFDKNYPEVSGYAAALADATGENVWLAPMPRCSDDPPARFDAQGVLQVRDSAGDWHPIRAAFRYVTQQPWTRLPLKTRTAVVNPVVACLAGGRNKLMASKAYDFFNADVLDAGLGIHTPKTIRDVSLPAVPLHVERFGGQAVVKVPYGNAGQGVYTITSDAELEAFMVTEHRYERFIVQSLIGNAGWSSVGAAGRRLYHVGTVPNRKGDIFAADLRCMVAAGPEGFRPIALYARRARAPLASKLEIGTDSWDMLGTNLSVKRDDGGWESETSRLMLMDRRDFNALGLGIDDLVEAYVQTVMSVIAIDRLAQRLYNAKNAFRWRLFRSLDDDAALAQEMRQGSPRPLEPVG